MYVCEYVLLFIYLILRDLHNIHISTTTNLMTLYHKPYTPTFIQRPMLCIVAIVDLYSCRPYCTLHKSLLLTAPIHITSKTVYANFVRPDCYIALCLYITHLFLRRTRFSVWPLAAHFFDSGQMQPLKIAAAQGLGNSCTEEPDS